MKIISYQKHVDNLITRTLVLASDADGNPVGTELATLADGLTYVSMPTATKLPAQPAEIKASVKAVTLTSAQIAEIKKTSPHVALINQRVREQIEVRYRLQDELKLLRLAPSPETTAYNDYAESCRADGRAEKAAIGL